MSLLFADASTDKVSFGNTGTDPTTGSLYMWTYPLSVTTTRRLWDKAAAAGATGFWRVQMAASGTGRLRCLIDYATTDADATSNDNFLVVNKWQFLAFVYDGVNGPKIYTGDLTTPVAEVTYAAGPIAPVGGRVTDSGGAVVLGNQANTGASSALNEHIAVMNWIPGAALSLGELLSHQFRPRPHVSSKAFSWVGFNGTGTQPDLSGNGNNGTVTGTTQSANVPLGPPFGFEQRIAYAVAAGSFKAAWARGSNQLIGSGQYV